MAKKSQMFMCSDCGYESVRWLGQCPSCKNWNTFVETNFEVLDTINESEYLQLSALDKITRSEIERLSTGFSELDRVLGGGLVKSEVVLLSGEPGIGKSTLLLQLLGKIAATDKKVCYVSAEESLEQIAIRADRIQKKSQDRIKMINGFEIGEILKVLKKEKNDLIIFDSVQTFYSKDASGLPGGFAQVKNVVSKVVTLAKTEGVSVILVGQINKQGDIAGPKLIEHLVDAVLHMEGDELRGTRIIRCLKNRFGSVNEIGVFTMGEKGMQDVTNPDFASQEDNPEHRIGVARSAILEGNRVFLIEVQALTVNTPFSLPKRVSEGVSKAKVELMAAIINKYTNVNLNEHDIYINLEGGFRVKDPGLDLAIVLAIISSIKKKPLPVKLVAHGEISLTGAIRKASRYSLREEEIKRLGYQSFVSKYPKLQHVGKLTSATL